MWLTFFYRLYESNSSVNFLFTNENIYFENYNDEQRKFERII